MNEFKPQSTKQTILNSHLIDPKSFIGFIKRTKFKKSVTRGSIFDLEKSN